MSTFGSFSFGGQVPHIAEEDENDPLGPTGNFSGFTDGSSGPPPAASSNFGSNEGFPSNYATGRRTSVSAEVLTPNASSENWTPPLHKKTPAQLERLKEAIAHNILFNRLSEEQSSQVLGALVEKPIPAKDIKVISQGDAGEWFYVVEKGTFDVYVNKSGSLQPGPDGMGAKVGSIEPGGSFGELALMYNAPRAATIVSTESGSNLWALDRVTFRKILLENTSQQRRLYESFLDSVELLAPLHAYERAKIADALDTQDFQPGAVIIKEGDKGESFYIVESGEADCFKSGITEPVKLYKRGDYFGELALLDDKPRAASVIAKTEVKVASLDKDAFQRLLGPLQGIMRRDDPSKRYAEEHVDPLAT
jgi:cAMP-dependent protein kinase regulator